MKSPMVDTNVVIFAMRRPRDKDPKALIEMMAASASLIRKLDPIRICAVTYVEILRGLRKGEATTNESKAILGRLQVEAVDGVSAALAAQLLQHRNVQENTCTRCLGSDSDRPCVVCKRIASPQQRINDALIVATAETRKDVPTLYAFDNGVLTFAKYIQRCEITRPPHAYGALWGRLEG